MNAWFPPGVDPVERAALVSGIPPWIDEPIRQWVEEPITNSSYRLKDEFLMTWDIVMQNSPTAISRFLGSTSQMFWMNLTMEERVALVDFVLHTGSEKYDAAPRAATLEAYLRAGGSEWRVGRRNGNAGLEKRVPQGVADAAEAIMLTSNTAGALLSESWHAAFGRGPNPEVAYSKAIKAVEEAGAHIVSPSNARATLGTMARDMEAQANWSLPLEEDPAHPSASVPYMMVRSLWSAQPGRHGGNDYREPTQEEAEAAVLLAVPLVQWFSSGLLVRRDRNPSA